MSTATVPAGWKPLHHEGDLISSPAGRFVVAVQVIRPGVYRTSINEPATFGRLGRELDGASYASEQTARDEAVRILLALRQHGTREAVAEAHTAALDLAEANRRRYGSEAAARVLRHERTADATAPLAGRAVQLALLDDITRHLTALAA